MDNDIIKKYKIGTKVKIIRNTCCHDYKLGSIKTITAMKEYDNIKLNMYFFSEGYIGCYARIADMLILPKALSKNIKTL